MEQNIFDTLKTRYNIIKHILDYRLVYCFFYYYKDYNQKMIIQEISSQSSTEAIYDICLTIGSIKNITEEWTPRFYFQIFFQLQNGRDCPSPYQILQSVKYGDSSVSLECYKSSTMVIGPKVEKQIKQSCTFRGSMPVEWLQLKQLACCVQIYVQDKCLATMRYRYESTIGLINYIPIFTPALGISIQAKIQTQLLGIRSHKNFFHDSNQIIYKAVDYIFHQSNRLSQKLKRIKKVYKQMEQSTRKRRKESKNYPINQQKQQNPVEQNKNLSQSKEYEQFLLQLEQLKQQKHIELNASSYQEISAIKQKQQYNKDLTDTIRTQAKTQRPNQNSHSSSQEQQATNSTYYKQYSKIKSYREPRIFKNQSRHQHRDQLLNFVNRINEKYLRSLQTNWQRYLELSIDSCLDHIKTLKDTFREDFATQVKNKIIRNKEMENKNQCALRVNKIKINVQGFNLINRLIESQDKSRNQQSLSITGAGKHLMVLVHGYGANSLAMAWIQRTIRYLYPHIDILNSKSNQNPDVTTTIQTMGRNLAIQVEQYMSQYQNPDEVQISFVGYSLGGIVVRAALVYLQVFRYNMSTFISLSAPHLGHISHSNKLAKVGMMAINAIWHSIIIDTLLLKDNKDSRLSFLYTLSTHSGLSWFKTISLYGSASDGYVSSSSALIHTNKELLSINCDITEEMAKNINQVIKDIKLTKFQIKFHHEKGYKPDFSEIFIGRSSHLAFSNCQPFINCFLLQNYKYLKPQQIYFAQQSE